MTGYTRWAASRALARWRLIAGDGRCDRCGDRINSAVAEVRWGGRWSVRVERVRALCYDCGIARV